MQKKDKIESILNYIRGGAALDIPESWWIDTEKWNLIENLIRDARRKEK